MNEASSLLSYVLIMFNLGVFGYLIKGRYAKIHDNMPNILNFTIQPKLLRTLGLLIGQIGIIFLYFTFIATPLTQISCERYVHNTTVSSISTSIEPDISSVMCQLVEFNWFGQEKSQKRISGLLGATLEKQSKIDHKETYYEYQVRLLTNKESIPFTRIVYIDNDSYEQLKSIVSSINQFLTQIEVKNIVLEKDDRLIGYVGGGITIFFSLLALLIIAAGSFVNCNFDKDASSMIISRYRWFGRFGKAVFQYSLNEIVNVKLEHADAEDAWVYRIIFVLESGETVALTRTYNSGFEDKQEIVNIIKAFLSLNSSK